MVVRRFTLATIAVALISAVFVGCKKETPKYTVQFVNTEGGTIEGVSGEYEKDERVEFKAIPNYGYYFEHWSGEEAIGFSQSSLHVKRDTTISAVFKPMFTATGTLGNHDYVDLGLESGTLWATCNVGATNPWEPGDYFAWGETTPKKDTTSPVLKNNYKYCAGTEFTFTKYCNDAARGKDGYTDNYCFLLPEDDAATVNWGNGFHTPTADEWKELREQCLWDEIRDYANWRGVYGYIVYKAKSNEDKGVYSYDYYGDGYFDKIRESYSLTDPHIFIPITIHTVAWIDSNNDTTYHKESEALYWANTLVQEDCSCAYGTFRAGVGYSRRWGCCSVRPVVFK